MSNTSTLDALLNKLSETDPDTAKNIRREVDTLTHERKFGLVFNEHAPETVELHGRMVRRGDTVKVYGDKTAALWRVVKVHGRGDERQAELVGMDEVRDTNVVSVKDLTVVARLGEHIYPGLHCDGTIERGGDKPHHVVINAENYHALQALKFSHQGKVDCIYIDPPYNTGGDLTYNDKRVAREDANRHSKWLSFMQRRLEAAKGLLKPTGVIIVAIDDNEHAHLKLLMDKIFGERNFIANLVWDSPGSNAGKFASGGVDYMLVYAKIQAAHLNSLPQGKWTEPRAGKEEMLAIVEKVRAEGGTTEQAQKDLRRWVTAAEKRGDVPGAALNYTKVDADWRVFYAGDLSGPGYIASGDYPITNPDTGQVYATPNSAGRKRWSWSKSKMDAAIAAGDIYFGETLVYQKRYLAEQEGTPPRSVFEVPRRGAAQRLDAMWGERRFDFPKDTNVLARWVGIVTGNNPDSVILDFFGGSGSTMHAVMDMNAADGGRRQCLLITNNEVNAAADKELTKEGHRKGSDEWEARGIYRRVTKPRIETVVTGVRENGSKYSGGFEENVAFFTLTYEDPERVKLDMAFAAVDPLLWLRAGGQGTRIETRTDTFAVADHYAVLFDPDCRAEFIAALHDGVRVAYIVTDSGNTYSSISTALPDGVEPKQLYDGYLKTFEQEV